MKKQFIKFSVVALTVAAMASYVSCDKTEDPTLSVSPSADVVFEANGTSNIGSPNYTFVVETNQGDFTVTPSQNWVKANKTATGFTLTAEAINTLAGPPAAKVTVSAGKATPVEIGVTQKGAGSFLNVAPAHRTIVFSANGEKCTIGAGDDEFDPVAFTVGTNEGETWDVQKPEGQGWLTLTKSATGFSLSAEGYMGLNERQTTVTVSTSGSAADVEIIVKQKPAPAFLSVNESEDTEVDVDFGKTGGTQTFNVLTNYDEGWSVDPLTNADWLILDVTAGGFTLTAAENIYTDALEVTVTVRAGVATSISLYVTQEANPSGTARWAVTPKVWVVNSADGEIKQVWSDYIAYDGKGKVALGTIDDFIDAKTDNPNWPTSGVGDYCRHAVHNNVPNTEGFGQFFKGYLYNYFYIAEHKDEMCPAPWRVPKEADFIALDIAFEGTGGNYNADGSSTCEKLDAEYCEAQVRKYMAWGLQFGGMRNHTGTGNGAWSYVQGNAYLGGQELCSDLEQFSTTKYGYSGTDNGTGQMDGVDITRFVWAVYTKHYTQAVTSRGKERGWPVRCVRDGE